MTTQYKIDHLKNCNCRCHKTFELVFDCVDCDYYPDEEIEK